MSRLPKYGLNEHFSEYEGEKSYPSLFEYKGMLTDCKSLLKKKLDYPTSKFSIGFRMLDARR